MKILSQGEMGFTLTEFRAFGSIFGILLCFFTIFFFVPWLGAGFEVIALLSISFPPIGFLFGADLYNLQESRRKQK